MITSIPGVRMYHQNSVLNEDFVPSSPLATFCLHHPRMSVERLRLQLSVDSGIARST